jgi:hypothetical protein
VSIVVLVVFGWLSLLGIIVSFWVIWGHRSKWRLSPRKWLKYGIYELLAFVILLVPCLIVVGAIMLLNNAPQWAYMLIPVGLALIVSRFVRCAVLLLTICLPYVLWDPAWTVTGLILSSLVRAPAYVIAYTILHAMRRANGVPVVWVLNR